MQAAVQSGTVPDPSEVVVCGELDLAADEQGRTKTLDVPSGADVSLRGAGDAMPTLRGARVRVARGAHLTLSNLALRGGTAGSGGGCGEVVGGALDLSDVEMTGCLGYESGGALLARDGASVAVRRSVLEGQSAAGALVLRNASTLLAWHSRVGRSGAQPPAATVGEDSALLWWPKVPPPSEARVDLDHPSALSCRVSDDACVAGSTAAKAVAEAAINAQVCGTESECYARLSYEIVVVLRDDGDLPVSAVQRDAMARRHADALRAELLEKPYSVDALVRPRRVGTRLQLAAVSIKAGVVSRWYGDDSPIAVMKEKLSPPADDRAAGGGGIGGVGAAQRRRRSRSRHLLLESDSEPEVHDAIVPYPHASGLADFGSALGGEVYVVTPPELVHFTPEPFPWVVVSGCVAGVALLFGGCKVLDAKRGGGAQHFMLVKVRRMSQI